MPANQSDRPQEFAAEAVIPSQRYGVGEKVRIALPPRYLKTADPMPMLRPPDLVDGGEVGVVSEVRAGDQLAVRFRRGTFLLSAADLTPAAD